MTNSTVQKQILHFKSTGDRDPILLIHGIISDHTFFDELASMLETDYQVIRYDRRGYGDSPAPVDEDYSIPVQAEDAADILREHTAAPAWVFGNSAGGLVALTLAHRFPELVRGVVILETPLCYDAEINEAIDQWFTQLEEIRDSGKTKKALALFSAQIGGTSPDSVFTMDKIKRTYTNLSVFLKGELKDLHSDPLPEEDLAGLACPCALILSEHGQHSIFGRASADTAARMNWPIYRIPGYHNAAQDAPEAFAETLRMIFRRI